MVLTRITALLALCAIAACTSVPLEAPRPVTRHDVVDTLPVAPRRVSVAHHPSRSAYYDLVEGRDALGARMQMIDSAQSTIDVSTFLIKPDTAGRLFAAKLIEAADRGVRVRFLIDDVFTTAKDRHLAYVDKHENIELRMFNPAPRGLPKAVTFPFNFKRLNRRMHNKMFVVDNSMAIIGGRNIADEYYQLDTTAVFADFEIFTAGPDAAKLGSMFDTFWNDQYAVPLDMLISEATRRRASEDIINWELAAHPEEEAAYREALASPHLRKINEGRIASHSGRAWIITDPPQKLRNSVAEGPHAIANALFAEMRNAKRDVVMLTPYFVPEPYGVRFYASLVEKGIRVRIVTNSLAANNHPYVHGGYQPYREELLRAGVELYEIRADVPELLGVHDDGVGQPTLTMHSKMGVIDDDKVFVGSLNLDPRAIKLNTEHGMMIQSPSLARAMRSDIDLALNDYAYRVGLDDEGNLIWDYFGFGKPERRLREPQATGFQKLIANITELLDVELQL